MTHINKYVQSFLDMESSSVFLIINNKTGDTKNVDNSLLYYLDLHTNMQYRHFYQGNYQFIILSIPAAV